jgi:hypothetical protein
MGFLNRLSQPRYQPIVVPRPGVNPPYASAPAPDRQTTKIITDALATVRAKARPMPTNTFDFALETVGFTQSSEELIASGELDRSLYETVRSFLFDNYTEGSHLAIAEEMSRAGRSHQIERNYAGVYALCRSSVTSGSPIHAMPGTPQSEWLALTRYMFDIGYFTIRSTSAD